MKRIERKGVILGIREQLDHFLNYKRRYVRGMPGKTSKKLRP